MVERNSQIDIVIPYYNDNDKEWKNVLYDYMEKENSNDRQVTGDERYREWNCFKYWFRGVENNCKWVNKVFLIVASKSQIPKWLDTTNPKLRIVLHEDYIPKELLPTFNTFTIENFIPLIDDLSDNFVYCNDDYYFLNPTTKETFFINDYPVYKEDSLELKKLDSDGIDGTFYQILNNGMDLQLKINGDKAKWYALTHLPEPYKKDSALEILKDNFDYFIKANSTSKFRSRDKISNHLYNCIYKDTKDYYKFNVYKNSCYVSVTNETDFNNYKNKQMVCFNDTQLINQNNFEEIKNKMIDFFENKFPNKSSFEKKEV